MSLGAYQGGATWALVHVVREMPRLRTAADSLPLGLRDAIVPPRPVVLEVATGTSAGNINAVLAARHYCTRQPSANPRESSYWDAWLPTGWSELIRSEVDDENLAVFSRRAFDATWKRLDSLNRRPDFAPGCSVLIGLAVTKLAPSMYRIASGLEVPLQRFAGVFRASGSPGGLVYTLPTLDDVGRATRTDIIAPGDSDVGSLGEGPLGHVDGTLLPNSAVRALVEASGAFPLAFAPRTVSYEPLKDLNLSNGMLACRMAAAPGGGCLPPQQALFVDGGIFDNRPLNLAFELSLAVDSLRLRQGEPRLIAFRQALQRRAALKKDECLQRLSEAQQDIAMQRNALLISWVEQQEALASIAADTTISNDSLGVVNAQRLELTLRIDSLSRASVAAAGDLQTAKCGQTVQPVSPTVIAPWLLYFVRHEALRGTDSSQHVAKAPPRAGIAAALHILASTYGTAQTDEVRVFANKIGDSRQTQGRFSLGVNSRYPLLMGEQVSHFGAFLAPTFRKYDFYAGVYDGLRSALGVLYCRQTPPGTAPVPTGECEQQWLRIMLDQSLVDLDPSARSLIEYFFARERGEEPSSVPPALADSAYVMSVVLRSLADANLIARNAKTSKCTTQAMFIEDALCSEQLLAVLAEWDRLLTKAKVRKRYCHGRHSIDPDACAMLDDARAVYHAIALRVLTRLERVEGRLDDLGEPSHGLIVGVPLYVERAYNEQFRSVGSPSALPWVDANPTSTDIFQGPWYNRVAHLFPQNIGGLWNGHARWMEWRPTVYLHRVGSFSLAASTPIQWIDIRDAGHFDGGLSAVVMPPGMIQTISMTAHQWYHDGRWSRSADVTAVALSGLLRVGYRNGLTDSGDLFERRHIMVGLGDSNGLTARIGAWVGGSVWRRLKGPS